MSIEIWEITLLAWFVRPASYKLCLHYIEDAFKDDVYILELESLKVWFGEKGGKAEKEDLVMQLAFWQKYISGL